ncbi:MAG: AraC family transcriptional regulator ligand-binding domain-containing protein [Deltaproteobacteria bacterium]|nr:AraC family transcriptional regulator ligand-binding domain-containing protein [Deltaproteobacteria bacterium]
MRASPLVLRVAPLVGVPVEELARAAEVDPTVTALSYDEGVRLWQALERLTGDAFVGLTAGERTQKDSLGMFGLAFATARDLADGLRVVERILPILLREGDISMERDESGAGLVYKMPKLGIRHGVDHMFTTLLTLARSCVGGPLVPSFVSFQMSAPERGERYREVFGVTPTFDAKRCVCWFAAADLSRPLTGADPATCEVLLAHADALLASPPNDLITKVEAALLRSLDQGLGTLEDTAERMGTTPRTLQRDLEAAGTRFSTVKESLLQTEASRALRDSEESIDALASRLGYATRRSFERAFHRWTGQTPAAFRRG